MFEVAWDKLVELERTNEQQINQETTCTNQSDKTRENTYECY